MLWDTGLLGGIRECHLKIKSFKVFPETNAVRQRVPASGSRYMKRAWAKQEVGILNLKKFGCGRA